MCIGVSVRGIGTIIETAGYVDLEMVLFFTYAELSSFISQCPYLGISLVTYLNLSKRVVEAGICARMLFEEGLEPHWETR